MWIDMKAKTTFKVNEFAGTIGLIVACVVIFSTFIAPYLNANIDNWYLSQTIGVVYICSILLMSVFIYIDFQGRLMDIIRTTDKLLIWGIGMGVAAKIMADGTNDMNVLVGLVMIAIHSIVVIYPDIWSVKEKEVESNEE